jgi:hypothetical protein
MARHAGCPMRLSPAILCPARDFTFADRAEAIAFGLISFPPPSRVFLTESGDPGRTRTSDLQLRRLLLYPLSYGASSSARAIRFAAVRKMEKVASIYATGRGLSVAAKRHQQNNGKQ